jgi:antitoxin component of MazEF toxin-antitoxin module
MSKPNPELLQLRKLNNSLRLVIPKNYVEEHDLEPEDHVMWQPEHDGVRLRFLKPKDVAKFFKT